MEPNYCQTIVDNIKDTDILFFNGIRHFQDGCVETWTLEECNCNTRLEMEKVILHMRVNDSRSLFFGFTWCKALRGEIIRKYDIRFIEGTAYCEDVMFAINYCLKVERLKYITDNIYNYRNSSTGLSTAWKSPEASLLLIKSIGEILNKLTYPGLIQYFKEWVSKTILPNAVFAESNLHKRKNIINQAKRLCNKYGFEFPKKEIIKRTGKTILKGTFNKICSIIVK